MVQKNGWQQTKVVQELGVVEAHIYAWFEMQPGCMSGNFSPTYLSCLVHADRGSGVSFCRKYVILLDVQLKSKYRRGKVLKRRIPLGCTSQVLCYRRLSYQSNVTVVHEKKCRESDNVIHSLPFTIWSRCFTNNPKSWSFFRFRKRRCGMSRGRYFR